LRDPLDNTGIRPEIEKLLRELRSQGVSDRIQVAVQ
jgi:hypothetical protein